MIEGQRLDWLAQPCVQALHERAILGTIGQQAAALRGNEQDTPIRAENKWPCIFLFPACAPEPLARGPLYASRLKQFALSSGLK